MKFKMYLILCCLFVLTAFNRSTNLVILPGKSVGLYTINKSTLKEIRSHLGKGVFTKRIWFAPKCGMEYHYYTLAYPEKGICFTFSEDKIKNNDVCGVIELSTKSNAHTTENITAGISTRNDIYKLYGNPHDTLNTAFMRYETAGIDFVFEHSTNSLTDTVSRIVIYTPTVQ